MIENLLGKIYIEGTLIDKSCNIALRQQNVKFYVINQGHVTIMALIKKNQFI